MNSRAGVLVGDQVELAAPEARLDVGQAVVLVGRRPQALGEHREAVDAQRQLAALAAEDGAVDPDEVAEVELEQALHPLLAEHVDARLELDPAGAVDEVEERHLALAAARGEAAGDAVGGVGLGAGLEVGVRGDDLGDRRHAREGVRERVDARFAQAVELRAAGLEELGELGLGGLVAHERRIIAQAAGSGAAGRSEAATPGLESGRWRFRSPAAGAVLRLRVRGPDRAPRPAPAGAHRARARVDGRREAADGRRAGRPAARGAARLRVRRGALRPARPLRLLGHRHRLAGRAVERVS